MTKNKRDKRDDAELGSLGYCTFTAAGRLMGHSNEVAGATAMRKAARLGWIRVVARGEDVLVCRASLNGYVGDHRRLLMKGGRKTREEAVGPWHVHNGWYRELLEVEKEVARKRPVRGMSALAIAKKMAEAAPVVEVVCDEWED